MTEDDSKLEQLDTQIARRYDIIDKVGQGSYGIVWKAVDRMTGDLVAIKKAFSVFRSSKHAQKMYREIFNLIALQDGPFISQLIAVHRCVDDSDLYLVFDFVDINLRAAIYSGILQPIHITFLSWQLCCALKYIHSAGIVHRDVKPVNILVNGDGSIRLSDFGFSRTISSTDAMTSDMVTIWYRPPEILTGEAIQTSAVDMWAVGCILAEVLTRKPLFPGDSNMDMLERIIAFTGMPSERDLEDFTPEAQKVFRSIQHNYEKVDIKHVFADVDDEAVDLILKLLTLNPRKRLTAEQALQHKFLAMFHDKLGDDCEITAEAVVSPPLRDDVKYTISDYKNAIYRLAVTAPDIKIKDHDCSI